MHLGVILIRCAFEILFNRVHDAIYSKCHCCRSHYRALTMHRQKSIKTIALRRSRYAAPAVHLIQLQFGDCSESMRRFCGRRKKTCFDGIRYAESTIVNQLNRAHTSIVSAGSQIRCTAHRVHREARRDETKTNASHHSQEHLSSYK